MMETITRDAIHLVEQTLMSYTDQDMFELLRRFEKKQTALMVYLAAMAQRHVMDDDEQDLLFSQALVVWQVVAKHSYKIRRVRMNTVQIADTRAQQTETTDDFPTMQDREIRNLFDSHPQPELMGHLWSRVFEQPEPALQIRQEQRRSIFQVLHIVTDLLLHASSS